MAQTLQSVAQRICSWFTQPTPRTVQHRSRLLVEQLEDRVVPAIVGYYDMGLGQGNSNQVAAIIAAGHTPVQLFDLTAADLAGIEVIDVQNPSNSGYGIEYLSRLTDIQNAVNAGAVLVIHDRYVDAAETILPGGAEFNVVRNFSDSANIDVRDNTTLVTNGPGGIVTNSTLDGGNHSSHGFTFSDSLPDSAKRILSTGNPTHIVTFAYQFGEGAVIYSSIPLDFHRNTSNAFSNIYAPNVIAYAATNPLGNQPPTTPVDTDAAPNMAAEGAANGAAVGITAYSSDPNGQSVTYSLTDDAGGRFAIDPSTGVVMVANGSILDGPADHSITVQASDGAGGTSFAAFTITVYNVAPVITSLENSAEHCAAAMEGQEITLSGAFTDAGMLDTHSAVINWGDGISSVALIDQGNGFGAISDSHVYANGGVYLITVTLTDNDGGVHVRTTQAIISGAGVVDGALYVIGAGGDDKITINQEGNGLTKVHASFFPDRRFKTFASNSFHRIIVLTCGGDDRVNISGSVAKPTSVDGGDDNDHISGGGGRNVLIGGAGSDRLVAGRANDSRIASGTTFTGHALNPAVVDHLFKAWNAARAAVVDTVLDGMLVEDDDVDVLTSAAGKDLFFANLIAGKKDKITGPSKKGG